MHTIERQLQQNLNNIQDWASKNGFKFSKSKTVCMHFCQLRKAHDDPVLTLDGTPIPVVEETKFLGVIFDKKLTFIPHIKKLKAKCQKALNLLRVGKGVAQSDLEKAEEFNGQFTDVFSKNEHTQVPLLDRSAPFMNDIAVSKDGVIKLLKGLNPSKALGPD